MQLKTVKISSLKQHPKNCNNHPIEQINELQNSLEQFDQVKNIVVWQGQVIAGNGLLMAAKKKGRKEIETQDVSEWPEEKAIKFMIADNRLPELGIMDDDMLADLLKGIDEPLDIPGIDENFLDGLNAKEDELFDSFADAVKDTSTQEIGKNAFGIYIQCEDEEQQKNLLDDFAKKGLKCKALIS